MKLNLLKPSLKVTKVINVSVFKQNINFVQRLFYIIVYFKEKKIRNRKTRSKQPDPEPVILTLSSDEEDSNSSAQTQVS